MKGDVSKTYQGAHYQHFSEQQRIVNRTNLMEILKKQIAVKGVMYENL